jgi:hypothetical protein
LVDADDIDIVGQTESSVREALLALSYTVKVIGLKANEEKIEFMQVAKRPTTPKKNTGSCNFEIVTKFKYLGKTVTNDNNMDKELINRIILANTSFAVA